MWRYTVKHEDGSYVVRKTDQVSESVVAWFVDEDEAQFYCDMQNGAEVGAAHTNRILGLPNTVTASTIVGVVSLILGIILGS